MKNLAICFFLLLAGAQLHAQPCRLLASEDFNYFADQPLHGQQGGSGWAEAWHVQGSNVQLPGYQSNEGSLTFGNLRHSGHQASGGREYLTVGRRLNTAANGPFAPYLATNSDAVGSSKTGTLWMSIMLRKNQANNQWVFAGLHNQGLAWCNNCTQQRVEFGYFGDQSDVGGQRRWTLRIGQAYYPSNIPVTVGAAAFFVLKLTFLEQHTVVELFINPTELGMTGPPPTPTLTQNTPAPFEFRSLHLYLGNSANNGAADEVRLTASYPCAAPDSTVSLDLPPVAILNATPNDGVAPLTVTLSATASYDPEGLPLTNYEWQLGDGSPPVSGPVYTHTYNALGRLPVRLTITDASGQQHTVTQIITVRRSDHTFPCQSRFSMVRPASCQGSGGVIRIEDHPPAFLLRNAAGAVLTPTGNEYANLAPGVYLYEASSPEGCADRYPLHVPLDSTSCPGWQAHECSMAIATNLSGFADWAPERPLRNLMKHVRTDIVAYHDTCFCWSNGNASLISLTPNGYPTHIPQMINGVANKVRYVVSTEGANMPPGQYVLLYDGQGTITVSGNAATVQSTPGRLRFNVTGTDIVILNIEASLQANPVRNFRLLRLEDESANLDENPFYQGFLDKIAPFKALRFMDWGATNHNPVRHWHERTPLSYFTYATPQGVPYEVMIRLANHTRKDVWICVPHAADEDYLRQMAELFRNQLDTTLTIWLEYSNEVWNWIFEQAHYNDQNRPANLNYGRAMAEKAGRVFRIWHEVFGPQHKHRVKRVLGLQAGFNYLNEHILAQLDPSEWDYGSPTSYIGLDHSDQGNPVLHAGSTPDDIIANARYAWAVFRPVLRQDYYNVQLFGKEVVNYEGGQHFVGNVFGIPYPYQQAMWDAQYSLAIYHLYNDMLDTIRTWGSRMFGNFSLASRQESVYGSWGVLNHIDIMPPYLQTAPKYQALLDNICPDTPTGVVAPDAPPALEQSSLWVLPNPTRGDFIAQFEVTESVRTYLTLLDALGRPVWKDTRHCAPGQHQWLISPGALPTGIYRLVWRSDKGELRTASIVVK